jgi:hypothetical protein
LRTVHPVPPLVKIKCYDRLNPREAMAATEAVLGERPPFDPRTDTRSFTLVGSDYVALVLLRPLIAELADEAPGVHINVVAVGLEMEDSLRRGSADLLIYPVEIAERFADLPRAMLFEDCFVLAADRDNTDVMGGVDVARFSKLPHLAVGGPFPSLVDTQLRANAIVERFIGTPRRECLDHLLITGPRHLAAVLQEYLEHYNTHRPHRSLHQQPPASPTPPPYEATVRPMRRDRLGGLVHEYVQVA